MTTLAARVVAVTVIKRGPYDDAAIKTPRWRGQIMEIQPATNDLVTLDNVLLLADRDPGDIAYAHNYKYAKALRAVSEDAVLRGAEDGGCSVAERPPGRAQARNALGCLLLLLSPWATPAMPRFESSAPASQCGLCAGVSGCVRTVDIPAG
jgi:hypothetical protein